jgi:Fe-S oxidoreductase
MTVLDACPTRDQDRVHDAVRTLLDRINIRVLEPSATRRKGICCGDSFYGVLPVETVKARIKMRSVQMPTEDVAVYCVSCCKSMHMGGKIRVTCSIYCSERRPCPERSSLRNGMGS